MRQSWILCKTNSNTFYHVKFSRVTKASPNGGTKFKDQLDGTNKAAAKQKVKLRIIHRAAHFAQTSFHQEYPYSSI